MPLSASNAAPVVGFVVGLLVTVTGLGGGSLLLPLLVLVLNVSPLTAIGSSAVYMFFTKIGAVAVHRHRGNIDGKLVIALSAGSIPSSLAGVALLGWLRHHCGDSINDWLHIVIGATLLAISLVTLIQDLAAKKRKGTLRERLPAYFNRYNGAVLTGIVGGFLAGATSVGSGTVVMMLLLLFYSLPTSVLVGTDIAHAVILTGVTSLGQLHLGTVDLHLVRMLLIGSIPGVLAGAGLTSRVPAVWIRRLVVLVIAFVGFEMI